jgi:hypothetical protein
MLDYILVIIKLILMQIAYDTLLTKALLSGFILLFLIYYINRKKTKITIEDLGIQHGLDLIPFVTMFFGLYIFGLFYLRFCNFGKQLDLKELYNKFMIFITKQEISYIIITILFYILVITLFLIFFKLIFFNIKLNLFKLHIYIKSFFPLGFFEDTKYNTITQNYMFFYRRLSGIFSSLFRLIRKKTYIHILKKEYDHYKITKITQFLVKIRDKNALVILLLLIIYDIIFNNFVLTKMYYFMPIVFLYNLIKLIDHILSICQPFEEGVIASHLYFNIESINLDTFEIHYENNFEATLQDLKDIENKLNKEL